MKPPLLSLFLVAGCAYVAPQTVSRLDQLAPLTANPAQFAVTPRLPQGLRIQADGAVLTIQVDNHITGDTLSGAYTLVDTNGTYALSAGDADNLKSLQSTAKVWKDNYPDNVRGSLTLGVAGCTVGTGPDADGKIDVDIRFGPDMPDMPLLRGLTVSDLTRKFPNDPLEPCTDQQIRG